MPEGARSAGISVVIPAFGREQPLLRSIESVVTNAPQQVEILVIDDCSPVPLGPLLPAANRSGVPVRGFRLPRNRGPQAARNLGIRRARFSHVALLDSDDVFSAYKIDRLLALQAAGMPDILFHAVDGMDRSNRITGAWATGGMLRWFRWFIAVYNPVITPGLVFRRVNRLGPPGMRHCEDWAFVLRLAGPGVSVGYVPDRLASVTRAQGEAGGLSELRWQMRKGEFRARALLWKERRASVLPRVMLGSLFGLFRIAADVLRGRYRTAPGHGGVNG
jgi:glycosyltransferase involved in cell wall biosynthesis